MVLFALRIFFDHASSRFAANAKLTAMAAQTVAFAVAQLRGHGARKSIQFPLHKPLFQLCRGKGFVTISPPHLYIKVKEEG